MTAPPIIPPPPKFPLLDRVGLPFANRTPQFVPRSIDPSVPMNTYPGWSMDPAHEPVPFWIKAAVGFAAICACAAIWAWFGWL